MTLRRVWGNIVDWIKRQLGITPKVTTEQQQTNMADVARYESIKQYLNRTATVAQALTDMTIGESSVAVEGKNARAEFLQDSLRHVWDKINSITARTWGTGQIILYPGTDGKCIIPTVIDKDRFQIIDSVGDIIKSAAIQADYAEVDGHGYIRVDYHKMEDNGSYTIQRYVKSVDSDSVLPLSTVPQWKNIPPSTSFGNVEKMLFGNLLCPTDNRQATGLYGAPVTYGLGKLLEMQEYFIKWLFEEFDFKQVRLGVSKDNVNDRQRAEQKTQEVDKRLEKLYAVFKTDPEGKQYFQIFDPPTRQDAVIQAVTFIDGLIEKGMGVNKGVLTDLVTDTATATAIRASTYNSWSRINGMRRNIERALADYIDACNVIANGNGSITVIPKGEYKLAFDWDYSLLESSEQTFMQLAELETRGLVSPERLNMFVTGQDEKKAKKEVTAAKSEKPSANKIDIDSLLSSSLGGGSVGA